MSKYRQPKKTVVAALRLPEYLYARVMSAVESEDTDFSKFVRRSIRKEMINSKFAKPEELNV